MSKVIWYVIPCYNEEAVIDETVKRVANLLGGLIEEKKISPKSKILFVDDGSTDTTWEKLSAYALADKRICAIRLSKNQGHQNALFAGLMTAGENADAVISMDADLQDDIFASVKMIESYLAGNEIVYGVRKSRDKDTLFKRVTAQAFYKFMKFLGTQVIYNHADYRLMGKKSIEALSQYKEVNLFLRGIVPELGFKTDTVLYERGERYAGESKYPFRKMLSFAVEGISSFSIKPIKIASIFATLSIIISIFMLIYCVAEKIAGRTVPGWSSLGASIWAVGAIELFMIGIIGEYIGKLYFEVKQRPRYIIEETVNI